MDAPAAGLRDDGGLLLVCRVRFEHEVANALLRRRVDDGPQQRERATFTVHRALASRKGHVSTGTASGFPDAKADQLEAFERACGEMQLGLRELPYGVPVPANNSVPVATIDLAGLRG